MVASRAGVHRVRATWCGRRGGEGILGLAKVDGSSLVAEFLKVGALEDLRGLGLLAELVAVWLLDTRLRFILHGLRPLGRQGNVRGGGLGEALGVVAEPQEELQVLGRRLNVDGIVHEVANCAWLPRKLASTIS